MSDIVERLRSNGDDEAADEIERLRAALVGTLGRYVDLVNCGDCGFWNPEDEPHVINARAALDERDK